MAVLVEGALIGYGVTKLLNNVLKAVSLLVKSNKSFSALCNMLTDLKPVVADITKRTEPTQPWNQWLQRLHEQLQKAELLVHKFTTQSKYDIVMKMKRSAELVEVTEAIRNLREGAGSAGLVSSLQNSEKLDKLIRDLRTNHQDLLFSGTTRNVVNHDVARPHYLSVHRTNPSSARQEIRDQADAMTIPNDVNRRSEHGATSSNTEQQWKSRGISKSREIIFGDDDSMEKVKKLLLSDEKSKLVGIWSMGGAGKTLTAQRVYNDPDIQNRFVGGTLWLTVGREQTPLSLLHLLYKKITGNQATEEDVKEQVESKLGDHVLLVLDDVWSMTVLHSLNVAHHAGSKILVTTRDQSLLERVSAEKLQLPMLSREHSWQLFCWHAFGGENNVSRSLERDAREVANECKGLPLALKVIGSTMRGKSDPRLWKIDVQRLRNAYTISEEHEKQLFHRLQLSIDDLGQFDERLIDCFYYFAAFPEDCSVRLDDLLSLWMGEGMVRGNSALSPEDEAYLLLGHLIARSLIELDSFYNNLVYKIHDVLRDLVRHNLQHNLKPDERLCLYQPGMQLTRFPEEWKSSDLQTSTTSSSLLFPSVQRMSLMFNDLEELPSQRLIAPHLLVFLARDNNRIESLPRQLFAGLSHLRVLDLSSTSIKEILGTALRDLKHLMLLNLSQCKKLEKIPDSIKYLQNLKEFRLNGCEKLKAIPSGVRFLKNLQTLDMDSSDAWDHKESEIRLLRFRPSWMSMGVAILHDVTHLTALTNLSVSSGLLTELSINFNSLKLLRHLLVDFIELRSFPDPSSLKELESLTLRGCQELTELPEGITVLPNLSKLTMTGCYALSSLPALDKLPLLKHLDLSDCTELLPLPDSFGRVGSFPSLEELKMDFCENSDFPKLEPGAMPQLSILSLCSWSQLRQLPESLSVLENLHGLELDHCDQLETLEPVFNLNSFPCLEELRLRDTKALTRLPGLLAAKPTLVKLDLTDCPAGQDLPAEFRNVERLHIVT